MMIIYISTALLIGFLIGIFFNMKMIKFLNDKRYKKTITDQSNKYKEILSKIENKKIRFVTRINDVAYFKMNLSDFGKIDIFYFLSKKDISIFRGEKCLLTSINVDKQIIEDITKKIDSIYTDKMNDVINFMGLIIHRNDFEKTFNISLDDIKKEMNINEEQSDINGVIKNNENKFDIDDILDKINKVGLENLTKDELNFLNNYNS